MIQDLGMSIKPHALSSSSNRPNLLTFICTFEISIILQCIHGHQMYIKFEVFEVG
jgi:hypothetical protein